MPATSCNSCHELITFVLNENGRWRPVDVTYTVVELDGDEMLAVQENGAWRQLAGRTLRVYKAHSCIENPSWNQGPARTRQVTEDDDVDMETGVIEPGHVRRGGYFPEPVASLGSKERAARSYLPEVLAVECPLCLAQANDPCSNTIGYYLSNPHVNRNWRVSFTEGQSWPPKANQRGYRAMRAFLASNAHLFALSTEGATP